MSIDKTAVLSQIDDMLGKLKYIENTKNKQNRDGWYLDLSDTETAEITTLLTHALERFRPPGVNAYGDDALKQGRNDSVGHLRKLGGMLSALRDDYAADRLQSFRELVHAEVFADFLEMADHLYEEGYKDAAAVIAGGVLEEHLRKLCGLHALATTYTDGKGKGNRSLSWK